MYQSYSGYAFAAILFAIFVIWFSIYVFEIVWNHLFHYILINLFNYDLKKINMKMSLAILVAVSIISSLVSVFFRL